MKTSYLRIITFILLCWMVMEATAQEKPSWIIGVKGGWSYTSIASSNMGRVDETYSPLSGYDVGVQALPSAGLAGRTRRFGVHVPFTQNGPKPPLH